MPLSILMKQAHGRGISENLTKGGLSSFGLSLFLRNPFRNANSASRSVIMTSVPHRHSAMVAAYLWQGEL
jgi:hypothetical protein